MKLVPLQDRVVISPQKQQEVTTGGIIIPDTANEGGTVRGEVIAIGIGKRDDKGNIIPMELKVGDKVLYGTSLYGTTVSIDGEEFVVMREENILAILEN
jgi:chaperonin GroES